MIYITMLGAEIGLRDGSQITILGATSWLSKKKQKILDIFANIIVVIFSCTLFMTTIGTIKRQIVSGQSTPSLRIPMYIPYLSITVFALIIAFVQVIRCIHKLKHFK
jgi:TRAP-type C4-dicarboxylate transport system permease small subunit